MRGEGGKEEEGDEENKGKFVRAHEFEALAIYLLSILISALDVFFEVDCMYRVSHTS
jgi:hypothetical protein